MLKSRSIGTWGLQYPDVHRDRSADPLVTYPRMESFRSPLVPGGVDGGVITGLCEVGHQGLLYDKEFGLYYNRARMLHPTLGRFLQRDPIGYKGGMNLLEYCSSNPSVRVDPSGLIDWDKFWQAWDIYWGLSDEGKWKARALMEHYVLGGGALFDRGLRYEHVVKRSIWTSKTVTKHILTWPWIVLPQGEWAWLVNYNLNESWSDFMMDRPELQNTARKFYRKLTSKWCKSAVERYGGGQGRFYVSRAYWFNENAPHTKLRFLESMLITLYGSQRLQVTGYRVTSLLKVGKGCDCFISFRWVTWTWHDKGDLDPRKWTTMDSGKVVPDILFEGVGLGKAFPIKITWADERAVWTVRSKNMKNNTWAAERLSGWPKAFGE